MSTMNKWGALALTVAALVGCSEDESSTKADTKDERAAKVEPEQAPAAEAAKAPATEPTKAPELTPPSTEELPAPEPKPALMAAPLPIGAIGRLGTTAMRHASAARAIASSADGSLVASSDDSSIRVWSSKDGSLSAELSAPQTVALAFTADGAGLVSAGEDGVGRFWDLASKQETAKVSLLGDQLGERGDRTTKASAISISTDASLLIAGHEGGKIAVWDLAKRERRAMFNSGHGFVSLVAISPDRTLFATSDYADSGAIIAVFEVASGERVATLEPSKGLIYSVAFTLDNSQVVFGTQRDGLHLWNIATNTLARTLDPKQNEARALWLTGDGETVLASSGTDFDVRSWELASGREGPRYQGHAGAIADLELSGDGKVLVSAAADNTVRVWDLATAEPFFSDMGHGGPVTDLAWSADGSMIATAATDGALRLWDADSYALLHTVEGEPGYFRCVGISADGSLVAANTEREVRVIDAQAGTITRRLAHTDRIFAVDVSADGSRIASGGFDGVRIWGADGVQQHLIEQRGKRAASLRFDASGATLASGWEDGRVRIIDVASGEVTSTIKAGMEVQTLAYSASGERLALRSAIEKFSIYDAASGKAVAKVPLPNPFSFGTNDNLLLAAGMLNNSSFAVVIVDVPTAEVVREFLGHGAGVTDAEFAPDGNRFASASEDTTVLIWAAP